MKPRRKPTPYHTPVVKVKRAPGSPTKAQLKATAQAEARAVKTRWKTLIADASIVWSKLHTQELAKSEGNFHVLAGLVQLHYKLDRQESDRQVNAFFAKHSASAATPAVAAPAVVAAAPAA